MRRREFITLLGGAAAWPLAARAQQPAMPVVGFLRSTTAAGFRTSRQCVPAGPQRGRIRRGPERHHRVSLGGQSADRLPGLAADLVRRQVAVIVGNTPAARAAKAATTTIPIVFVVGADPVRTGLVASLNRPGGNVTGVGLDTVNWRPSGWGCCTSWSPRLPSIAVLVDPNHCPSRDESKDTGGGGSRHRAANPDRESRKRAAKSMPPLQRSSSGRRRAARRQRSILPQPTPATRRAGGRAMRCLRSISRASTPRPAA